MSSTTSTTARAPLARKRGPPAPLSLGSNPTQSSVIVIAGSDQVAMPQLPSVQVSAPEPKPPAPSRNVKRLSLSISGTSISSQMASPMSPTVPGIGAVPQPRRHSVASLPNASVSSILRRNDEGDDAAASAYANGPIEIMPRVWLGSEDNAKDWKGLIERGIKSILNVAKEVSSPFDHPPTHPQPIRNVTSTPNLNTGTNEPRHSGTYQPAHLPSGRPGMHYLKMPWSHGQADLVRSGFAEAMQFIDEALARREGVLIHCQCGVSRSATMVIAFVMRSAAVGGPNVPEDVLALRGRAMQAAYDYVQKKSTTIGPNMSLIYQLLDYERALKADNSPGKSSFTGSEDEEWERQRRQMDSPDQESNEILKEAKELDREMEERRARKLSLASSSSNASLNVVPPPNPAPWRVRYGSRSRAASMDSNFTSKSSVSVLSEDPLEEEDEEDEQEPKSVTTPDTDATDDDVHYLGMQDIQYPHLLPTPTAEIKHPFPPPSAPATKMSFDIPPPSATPFQTSFSSSVSSSSSGSRRPTPKITLTTVTLEPVLPTAVELTAKKEKRRPPPLQSVSPIVPFPSVEIVVDPPTHQVSSSVSSKSSTTSSTRSRRLSSRLSSLVPFPVKNALAALASPRLPSTPSLATPTPSASQTLFVFPPSPRQRGSSTPSVLTLTSTPLLSATFTGIQTPRADGFRKRTDSRRSWIGLSAVTPTLATARVDARGSFES